VEVTELRVVVTEEVADRLASEAAQRGTSTEDVATVLRLHVPPPSRSGPFGFIGIARAKPGALSVAEAERRLEGHLDEEFAQ
jgi:hypothetical protein